MTTSHNTPLFAEERRMRLLTLLNEKSKLTVPQLVQHFDVSPATIRSDLRELENSGLLKRTHGGAISIQKATYEPSSPEKKVAQVAEKQRIAKQALVLIDDGDTIALDSGSTTFELAKLLPTKHHLTVVTNDIQTALMLEGTLTDASIVVLGGILRGGFHATLGAIALRAMAELNVDKSFLAANAFSETKGFTTPSETQAELKKAFIHAANESFVLCDSSKYNQTFFIRFADFTDINTLITDSQLSQATADKLTNKNSKLSIIRA